MRRAMRSLLLVLTLPLVVGLVPAGADTVKYEPWTSMEAGRFPGTPEAYLAKCLVHASANSADQVDETWCHEVVVAYEMYKTVTTTSYREMWARSPQSPWCEFALVPDGTLFKNGTTGSMERIELTGPIVQQLGRDVPAVLCTYQDATFVFYDEVGRGCNNLNEAVETAAVPVPVKECEFVPTKSKYQRGQLVVVPGFRFNGSGYIAGSTTRIEGGVAKGGTLECTWRIPE